MKLLVLISYIALALFTGSCRTTRGESGTHSRSEVASNSLSQSLELNAPTAEKLYLRLLSIELAAGIKVPQESLHTSRGLFICEQNGAQRSCGLRARLMGDALSAQQRVEQSLAEKFLVHTKTTRPKLQKQKLVLADIVCDYIGPKSPPYNMEKISCTIHHARHPNEVIIGERTAEKVANSIRGNAKSDAKSQVSLRGTVICRDLKGSNSSPCVTRGFEGDTLSSNIRELDRATSTSLHRTMVRAIRDHAILKAKDANELIQDPKEILGRVHCQIDLTQTEVYGGHLCQIEL